MPPAGKRTRAEAVAVPKRDQIISAWLRGVLEPRTDLAAAQRMVYPTETVFTAPYVTHITVSVEHPPCLLGLRCYFAVDTVHAACAARLCRTFSIASCACRVSRVS